MKTIIAGSRTITNMAILLKAIQQIDWTPTTIICGCAKGADKLGETWALQQNIPILYFPAKWELYGKSAGIIRNKDMAMNAEALIALWDGISKGTASMIKLATLHNLKTHIYTI